jgi:hypothetical protein
VLRRQHWWLSFDRNRDRENCLLWIMLAKIMKFLQHFMFFITYKVPNKLVRLSLARLSSLVYYNTLAYQAHAEVTMKEKCCEYNPCCLNLQKNLGKKTVNINYDIWHLPTSTVHLPLKPLLFHFFFSKICGGRLWAVFQKSLVRISNYFFRAMDQHKFRNIMHHRGHHWKDTQIYLQVSGSG